MQRLLSKILANRCSPFMDNLVLQAQSGFVKGRSIQENFLYANDLVHFASRQKIKLGILKIDIRKAFDTLDWKFLKNVLKALGFPNKWIFWISECVLKGQSRVIINGQPGKTIHLKRGVRQGDAISPLLFILSFDFLGRWLNKLSTSGVLQLPFPQLQPALFYADDSILFFNPSLQQVQILKLVLLAFQQKSGLSVNWAKSEILVTSADSGQFQSLADVLGCTLAEFPMSYLGLPLSDKKLKKIQFAPLIHRFNRRLKGWTASLLSIAGRKVLLDACLSALPIYYMSTLKIPISVLNQIDSIRRRFFWHGTKAEEKRMAMVGWNTITNPKLIGGLGVLDLKAMNQSLLARWCWKWLSSERSLWKNLNLTLQGDRFSLFPLASTVTHAMRETLPILQVATKINLSSGLTTAFWHQDWGFGIWANVFSLAFSYCLVQNATVHQFF